MSGATLPLRTGCPPAEEVAAFVAGALDARAVAALEVHVATCSECREVIAALRPETSARAHATRTVLDPPDASDALDVAALLATSRTGDVLGGGWRLERLLGTGGMGQVFEASHVVDGRRCALKLLRPELARHADLVRRFEREQHAAARIAHPAFVAVHATGVTTGGAPYFVMDLVVGRTLCATVRERGPLPEADVRKIGIELLDALGAAHAAGVIHRDVKPDNLAIEEDGRLRVLDFGIARVVADAETSSANGRTATGQMLGTPAYMPPEQARALPEEIDERADVFAAAATLVFLLTGRPVRPSTGTLYEAMTSPVLPVARLAPTVSAALASVLDRALAFDKRDRYATAAGMQAALAGAEVEVPRQTGRRRWLAAGAVVAFGIATVGAVLARRSEPARSAAPSPPPASTMPSVETPPRASTAEPPVPPALPEAKGHVVPAAASTMRAIRRAAPPRDPLERRE